MSSTEFLNAKLTAIRDEIRSLGDKGDNHYERLSAHVTEALKEVSEVKEILLMMESRRNAIVQVGGGLVAIITASLLAGGAISVLFGA